MELPGDKCFVSQSSWGGGKGKGEVRKLHSDTWRKTNNNRKEENDGGFGGFRENGWEGRRRMDGRVEGEWMVRKKEEGWEGRIRMDGKVEEEWMRR